MSLAAGSGHASARCWSRTARAPTLRTVWPTPNLTNATNTRRFILAEDPVAAPPGLERAVVAIGNFDGLHRGHKAVMERARALARATGRPAALLTFEPHPSDYFARASIIFRLTPLAAKARLVERLGMDGMIVLSFDAALANLSAEDFVRQILVERLHIGGIVAGHDFHFGRKRGGTPAFLLAAGADYGFDVEIVSKIEADAAGALMTASSTATRAALEVGDVERATVLLGHAYAISGVVRQGQKLGRTLGFPTANIEADPSCRLRHGIYAVRAEVDGATHAGVASWGRRPTVDNGAPLLEVFLFDFDGDLYGKTMSVDFVAWLRAEEKFDDLATLMAQMLKDAADARARLGLDPAPDAG